MWILLRILRKVFPVIGVEITVTEPHLLELLPIQLVVVVLWFLVVVVYKFK